MKSAMPSVGHASEGPLSLHHSCRDLKPENVLLAPDGTIKLSDFGLGHLATAALTDNMLQTTCGTPNYVAPEVLMRKGYKGGPADIWSLGEKAAALPDQTGLSGFDARSQPDQRQPADTLS